ncbi:hypothetical protein [Vibrio phage BONAISHI]|nr:hypothetical protein [Vibrio phage BONAISHI]
MTIEKLDFTDQAYTYSYHTKWKSGFSGIEPDGDPTVFNATKAEGDNLVLAKAATKTDFDNYNEGTKGNTTLLVVDDTAQGYFGIKVSRKPLDGDTNTDDGDESEAGGYYLDNRFSFQQSTDYSSATPYDTGKLFFVNEHEQVDNGGRPTWEHFGQRVIDSRISYLLNKENDDENVNPLYPFIKDLVTQADLTEFANKVNTGISKEYPTKQDLLDDITANPGNFAENQSFLIDAWDVSSDPQNPEYVRAVVSLNASKQPEYVYQYGGFDSSVLDLYQSVTDAVADNASHLNDVADLEAKLTETQELLQAALDKLSEVEPDVTNSEAELGKANRKLVREQAGTPIDLDPAGNLVLYLENGLQHARIQTRDSQELSITMNVTEYYDGDGWKSFNVKGEGQYRAKRDISNNKSNKIVLAHNKKGNKGLPAGARVDMFIAFRPETDGGTLRHNAVYKVSILGEGTSHALVDISHYPSPDSNQNNFASHTFFDF